MKSRSLFLAGAAGVACVSAIVSQPAYAQDAQADDSADELSGQIIVTGTRRTDRTVTDSSVPIDIVTSEALLIRARPKQTGCLTIWCRRSISPSHR